ncbi:MAG: 5-(carboxyamino)imidazole ribonucleotide synthase [Alphaproteobacteria bacterium]|nr:5-(carboxyamino)imidazole ribonucleotide synthase [Alphaproteobacteria bacterium]
MPDKVVPPSGTVGIVGGGQLGRMLALAAARLGLKSHIFAPDADSPAFQVVAARTRAAYDDELALKTFASTVDAITYEFENIPARTVTLLSSLREVRPSARALDLLQDRFVEKKFVRGLGIETAAFAPVDSEAGARAAFASIGAPSILKTSTLGYDGKGQRRVQSADDAVKAWHELGKTHCILEGFVDFKRELSIVAARGADGSVACYDLVENVHENHVLRTTLAPASDAAQLTPRAIEIARSIAASLNYVGVMAVELFETRDGRLLVNEIAPRVHNSGHWTIDACAVSQFEQHIRAVCGWPLGNPERHSDAVMRNLLGDEVLAWQAPAQERATCVHIYGKSAPKPGRKMGHITKLYPVGKRPSLG